MPLKGRAGVGALIVSALPLFGCEPECAGPRDPSTTEYDWVKVAEGSICAGTDDGCIDCWGDANDPSMLKVPYKAFDMYPGLACGITKTGEARCWSWRWWSDPIDTEALLPPVGRFDGVEVTSNTACWLRAGEAPLCPVAVCDGHPGEAGCIPQPESDALGSLVGTDRGYCGLASDGTLVCWGFPPALATHGPGRYQKLNAGYSICGIDADGTAWCSAPAGRYVGEVSTFEGDFVSVGAGCRLLLLDSGGNITDVPLLSCGGVTEELIYRCEIDGGDYRAAASFSYEACALPRGAGIDCWQEDDRGCATGTPADLTYWSRM